MDLSLQYKADCRNTFQTLRQTVRFFLINILPGGLLITDPHQHGSTLFAGHAFPDFDREFLIVQREDGKGQFVRIKSAESAAEGVPQGTLATAGNPGGDFASSVEGFRSLR